MTDTEARAALGKILFAELGPLKPRTWDEIIARARVLVERIRKSQQNESTLARIIEAPEANETRKKS